MLMEELFKGIREKMKSGRKFMSVEDIFMIFEFFRYVSEVNDDLRGYLQRANIKVQFIIIDANKKAWCEISDGNLRHGRRIIESPSLTLVLTMPVLFEMFHGERAIISVGITGDLSCNGSLRHIMAFQEFIDLFLDVLENHELVLMKKELNII